MDPCTQHEGKSPVVEGKKIHKILFYIRSEPPEEPDDPTYVALKEWRLKRSRRDEVPAYVVFHNSTLAEIAARRPSTINELATVPGVGPAKLERYGPELLEALAAA